MDFSACLLRGANVARSLPKSLRGLRNSLSATSRQALGGLTMKAQFNSSVSRFTIGLLVLVALVASTVVPALGQNKRRPRLRRSTRAVLRKTPPVTYYTVNKGHVIRVRMNQAITSETARVGDQFTTTVVDPVYASSVEVIPAGSSIVGQVKNVKRSSRQSKAGTIEVYFVSLRLPT